MSRFAALVAAATLTACGPLVINTSADSPSYHDDHDDEVMVLSMLGIGLIATLVAVAVGHDHDDGPAKQAPPIATRAADPSTMYFAPTPPVAADAEQLRLQRMYVQGQVLARAGRCDGALALGRQIARSSASYYAMYAVEPEISVCVNSAVNKLSTGY
jgi:hypothetical protein